MKLTECKRGHAMEGDNLRVSPQGLRYCRTCERERTKRYRADPAKREVIHRNNARLRREGKMYCGRRPTILAKVPPALIAEAVEAVRISGLIGAAEQVMPRYKFKAILRFRPDLHNMVAGFLHVRAAYRWTGVIAAQPNEIFTRVGAAVPKTLPSFIRDDVMGAMCEAVLAGELPLDGVGAAVRKYISEQYRQTDYWTRSLDAPLYHDSERTLLDYVSKGLWQ